MIEMPRPNRKRLRLADYDYSEAGAYFVTTVCHNRRHLFSNPGARKIALAAWTWLPERFPNVQLDAFVVMPNHVHAIIFLNEVEGDEHVIRDEDELLRIRGYIQNNPFTWEKDRFF